MINKFLEIKSIEEAVQKRIAEAKLKGEKAVGEAESLEENSIIEMRKEIKLKRHKIIETAQQEAQLEADKIKKEIENEITQIKVDPKLLDRAAKKIALYLIQ